MNVFANFVGHEDAATSLHILFEERLGYQLFVPDGGEDWRKLGLVFDIGRLVYHGSPFFVNNIKHIPILHTSFNRKALTVKQFMETEIDIVVVSSGRVEVSFYNLTKKYKPNAVFIRQIPNLAEIPKVCKNVLLATKTPMPQSVNYITHHPEHPHQFRYVPHRGLKSIKSFSNNLLSFKRDFATWNAAKKLLPEFQFFMHGMGTKDRGIPHHLLHKSMHEAMFIWHTKSHGGCGFVCREALACGRPLIVKKQYCKAHKTLAQDYLVDEVNCVDLSVRQLPEAVEILKDWAKPENYGRKCEEVVKCFKERVNFKVEAENIRDWISTLEPVCTE